MARTRLKSPQEYNPYVFSVHKAAAQTVTANTWTKVLLDTKDFDVNGNFDNTTNYQYTAPVNGIYQFFVLATPGASSTSNNQIGLNVGSFSSAPTYTINGDSPGNGQSIPMSGGLLIQLTAGQTVQLYVYCASTSAYTPLYLQGVLVTPT